MAGQKRLKVQKKKPGKRQKRRGPMFKATPAMSQLSSINTFPLPKRLKVNMVYWEKVDSVNPGAAGAAAGSIYRANDLYDPYQAAGGHQPSGFDQLMALYKNFVVTKSKITVTAVNDDATYPQTMCISLKNNTTAVTDITPEIENGRSAFITVGNAANAAPKVVSLTAYPLSFLNTNMYDDTIKGSASASPTTACYFHVIGQPISATDTGIIRFSVLIEYDVWLVNPNAPGLS